MVNCSASAKYPSSRCCDSADLNSARPRLDEKATREGRERTLMPTGKRMGGSGVSMGSVL